jgi:hypothetical protein
VRDAKPETAFMACLPSWRGIARGKPIIPLGGEISCVTDMSEIDTFGRCAAAAGLSTLHFYTDDEHVTPALCAAIRSLQSAAVAAARPALALIAGAGVFRDKDKIADLLAIASDPVRLMNAQHIAAAKLLEYDGEVYPSDGCAVTLSVLLQDAGIDVQDVFQAITLGDVLRQRGWTSVPLSQEQAGDIGSTCGMVPVHGQDHIYLVLRPVNSDEMIIADNQETHPHFRFISGAGGKTPTRFFLRAS